MTWMNIDEAAETAGVTVGMVMWLITQGRLQDRGLRGQRSRRRRVQDRVTEFSEGGERQVVLEDLQAIPDLAALNRQRKGV
mgnify:CR=1 FL=1